MFLTFLAAIGLSLLLGFILVRQNCPVIESLLLSVSVGYGVKMICDVVLLYRHFPAAKLRHSTSWSGWTSSRSCRGSGFLPT